MNCDPGKISFKKKPSAEIFSKSFERIERCDFDNDYIESVGRSSKRSVVNNSTFRSTVFVRCYFQSVVFTNCDFTSAKFIDCNLKEAKFVHCKFNYVSFRRTLVESSEIIANLPIEPNVRRDLLRNLRVDARELGNVEDESLYVRQEIEASDYFCMAAFLGKGPYLRNKYGTVERLGYLMQWLFSKVSGLIWGHGEKPLRVMYACMAFTLAVAGYLFAFEYSSALAQSLPIHERITTVLRLSASEFLGIPYQASADAIQAPFHVSIVAVCARYIFIGLLVSVLFRRLSRR